MANSTVLATFPSYLLSRLDEARRLKLTELGKFYPSAIHPPSQIAYNMENSKTISSLPVLQAVVCGLCTRVLFSGLKSILPSARQCLVSSVCVSEWETVGDTVSYWFSSQGKHFRRSRQTLLVR